MSFLISSIAAQRAIANISAYEQRSIAARETQLGLLRFGAGMDTFTLGRVGSALEQTTESANASRYATTLMLESLRKRVKQSIKRTFGDPYA